MVSDIFNIVFICDDNYALPTRVALNSLIATQKKQLHVKIVCVDLSTYNVHRFKQLATDNTKIDIIETTNLYKDFGENHIYVSKAALFKFALPNLINEDKVLYLDGDIIVKEDISDFYNTNISNYYAAVIRDLVAEIEGSDNIRIKNNHYFNSGVMLLNLAKMRKDNISDKLFDYKKHDKEKKYMDQDAFNVVFRKKVIYSDFKYNYFSIYKLRNYPELKGVIPKIIHYASSKPWCNLQDPYLDNWLQFIPISDIPLCLKRYIENERNSIINLINEKDIHIEYLTNNLSNLQNSLKRLEEKIKNRSFRPRLKKFLKSLFFSQKGNKLKYKVLGLPLLSQKLCTNKYVFRFLGFKFSFKKTKRNI